MTNHNQYKEKWLHWAKELQFLSQSALAYCKDSFDIERFERIRDISAEIISLYSGLQDIIFFNILIFKILQQHKSR